MQSESPISGQAAAAPAFAGLSAVPLFHAAWLFAAGIAVTQAVWLRPSLVLVALGLVAVRSKSAFFRVATNRSYRDKNDSWQQERAFLSCIAYGWRADAVMNHKKGEMLLAEGRLRTENWQSDDGTVRSELVLVVDSLQFITCGPRPKSAPLASNETSTGSDDAPDNSASSADEPF